MNVLTFDIEEWYVEKVYKGDRSVRYHLLDERLDKLLALLNEKKCKATFFCLGKIATDFPHVIKKIAGEGHEIGCHSNEHIWLTKLTEEQLKEDTHSAISALEEVASQNVISYRAPAFSIGEKNKWALEVLAECGIKNDASIFPASRDFGGFEYFPCSTPCVIGYKGIELNEFPISITKVLDREIAYSGGGYFRLLPFWFVKEQMKKHTYNMCYFHIADILTQKEKLMSKEEFERYFKESGDFLRRCIRYCKANIGRNQAFIKIEKLLSEFKFTSIDEYLKIEMINKVERI